MWLKFVLSIHRRLKYHETSNANGKPEVIVIEYSDNYMQKSVVIRVNEHQWKLLASFCQSKQTAYANRIVVRSIQMIEKRECYFARIIAVLFDSACPVLSMLELI